MKNNKAPIGHRSSEKYYNKSIGSNLHYIQEMFNGESVQADPKLFYTTSTSTYKWADGNNCRKYRNINIAFTIRSLYGGILNKRIEQKVREIEEQSGFRV